MQTPVEIDFQDMSARPDVHASIEKHVADLEQKIQERLASKVSFRYQKGQGAIEIRFYNDDDLDRILRVLGVSAD